MDGDAGGDDDHYLCHLIDGDHYLYHLLDDHDHHLHHLLDGDAQLWNLSNFLFKHSGGVLKVLG